MTDRIAEIEAEIATFGALYKHPREDALYLLGEVKRLEQTRLDLLGEISSLDDHNIKLEDEVKRLQNKFEESDSYIETYIDALKQRDERIDKLESVRVAAKTTRDAIAKMKDGMIYANSDLGRILHSYPELAEALAACEPEISLSLTRVKAND